MDATTLYRRAIKKYGIKAQLVKAMEECSELQHALAKVYFGKTSNVAEEIVDVEIMIGQIKTALHFPKTLQRMREVKLKRLERRLRK